MRLKTLKISGFKSFADRVVLLFDAPLIGIVGPNGCGKSNIVDAFRWVLGEQSARSLRGTQMHDIIFAGSAHRKGAPVAEVSVTLGEIQEGELALPHSEITITRRLYRDGNSEYLLNKQQARLRDIQHLFMGTGVGRGAFSIFEQGKIDRIISLAPTARREIFDEAAGIGRFLERKKETLRKLTSMMDNYNRLKDFHLEVNRQTQTLKKQAAAAELYLQKKANAESLEKGLLITKLKKLRVGASEELTTLSHLKERSITHELQLSDAEKIVVALKTKRELLDEQVAHLQEKVTSAERLAASHEAQYQQQQKRQTELHAKQTVHQRELEAKQKELATFSADLEAKRVSIDLTPHEQAVKGQQKAYLDGVQFRGQVTQVLQATQFKLEKLQESERLKQVELERLEQRVSQLQGLIQKQKGIVEGLKQSVGADLAQLKLFDVELTQLQQRKKEEESALADLKNKETELRASKQLLEKLKASREGFSAGAKRLLQASQDPKHELYEVLAPLASCIVPKQGEAHRLDAALMRYRQTLVAKTKKGYDMALAFATKQGLKDFSLFCLKNVKDPTTHFLHDATFDRDHYIDTKNVLFVYGEMVDAPFQQQERLQQIDEELAQVAKKRETINLTQTDEGLQQLRQSRRTLDEKHRKQEMTLVQENFALQRHEGDLKEIDATLVKLRLVPATDPSPLQAQIKEAELQLKEITEQLLALEKQWQAAEKELQNAREKVHAMSLAEAKLGEVQRRVKRLEEELHEVSELLKLSEEMLKRRDHLLSQAECETLKQTLKQERQTLQQLRTEQQAAEAEVALQRENLHVLEKEKHLHEVKLAQESALDISLVAELVDRFSMSAEEALASDVLIEAVPEAEKELAELRRSLERSGVVNLTAIESYAEEAKRFEELDVQLKDLVTAKEDLEALIAKLDHESRKLFKETFAQIRENFQRNFDILFAGGEADLKFTESHDILEAGIEITAKPPGKQMRSISLLSGGEKCLTALALLFSIFEVKPAPFCILDEVDAPLDETNVGRFTQMLQRYIDNTQFLIVTHNKKTMAVADRLIGVSMEEKGVSKLLSLTFSKTQVGV